MYKRLSIKWLHLYMLYDGDGTLEIIFRRFYRLLLFWPPAFSLFLKNLLISWNVEKKFWFDVWKLK